MKLRLYAACLLFWVFAFAAQAQALKCDICGLTITSGYYTMEDRVTGEKKLVCADCHGLEAKCFSCDLPIKEGGEKLPDGRFLCARDAAEAVATDKDALEVAVTVHDDLDRLLSRFLTLPETNVFLSIADRYQLEGMFKAPGFEDSCLTIYGATQTRRVHGSQFIHHISLLSHLRKTKLLAVCAHEYTHAWMGENVSRERKALLDHDTVEGFCELVAYKYMASRDETAEMSNIKKNTYTKGQIEVLIEADRQYGFDAVMEWIKSGEDNKLDLANLGRVRVVKDGTPATATADLSALLVVPQAVPTPVPDQLELKALSGTPQHPFALINNATFEVRDCGLVRMGQTNVTVQCLEIRRNSVVIQVAGSERKQELFLRAKP